MLLLEHQEIFLSEKVSSLETRSNFWTIEKGFDDDLEKIKVFKKHWVVEKENDLLLRRKYWRTQNFYFAMNQLLVLILQLHDELLCRLKIYPKGKNPIIISN